jgi:hypothetical protein
MKELKQTTIDFIEAQSIDDLFCFLRVYEHTTRPADKATYNKVKEVIQKKNETDTQEKELWG